jgi:hypothetical protein
MLEGVVDLLGNLREWSLEQCEDQGYHGHYLLGADYLLTFNSHRDDKRKPLCYTQDFSISTIGFRLVIKWVE